MNQPPPEPRHDLTRRGRRGRLGLASTVGVGTLAIALVVGIQLGSIPWRYRRQILLAQGFLVGALVGYVVGRVSGSGRSEPEG